MHDLGVRAWRALQDEMGTGILAGSPFLREQSVLRPQPPSADQHDNAGIQRLNFRFHIS
jgi:hypothetical protein